MTTLAAKADSECVKHQTHFMEDELTEEAKSISPLNADVSNWDVIERCVLFPDDEIALKRRAEGLGVIYFGFVFQKSCGFSCRNRRPSL
jgi:N-acetylneuraminate synthase